MPQRPPARWVRVAADPADSSQPDQTNLVLDIEIGPLLWTGPQGDGHCWHTDLTRPLAGEDARGVTWWSDLGEVRRADPAAVYPDIGTGDLIRWWPPAGPWLLAREDWALVNGYTYPPPPIVDSDGDGVPDDVDADPYDPTIQ